MNPAEIENVVIVGAGLSGLRTAERLRRAGYARGLTLLGAEHHLPYDRPPLSKKLLLQDETPPDPVLLRPRERWNALDVQFEPASEVTELDLPGRSVTLASGDTRTWDRLVIATGVSARTVPEWTAHGVHHLRTFEDCLRLRAALRQSNRLTVIGAGVLGCEVAAAARTLGLEVDLVEPLATPLLRAIGPQVGTYVAGLHQRHGVRLHTRVGVRSITRDDGGVQVTLTDGTVLEAGVAFAAIGSSPNIEWLDASGLRLGDGVLCDATGTTSARDVLAVGDVAHIPYVRAGACRLEHWTSAADTASVVAANILLPHEQRQAVTEIPYFWTDQYDIKLQTLGVPAPDDDIALVDGALDQDGFLALHTRGDIVTGVTAVGRAAMLNRCRPLLSTTTSLGDALNAGSWLSTG